MRMKFVLLLLSVMMISCLRAQKTDQIITVNEVSRIEKSLADDDMRGRRTFTPDIDRAADFIVAEFQKIGLEHWDTLTTYRQQFSLSKQKFIKKIGRVEGRTIASENIIVMNPDEELMIDENSSFKQVVVGDNPDFFRTITDIISGKKPTIVWISNENKRAFSRLIRLGERPFVKGNPPVIFVLHDPARRFSFHITTTIETLPLANVIGVLPGKNRKDEYVIFSAHYDHLGVGKPDERGDSIYNGANDNASGTTAVIMLAKYFRAINNNERSIIFVTFTGEEIGGLGSQYFSQHIDPDQVVAMFNIEMIGTDSKWGKNSGYITGFEKTDFGKILQKNLKGSTFRFEPDPYPQENLFYRSDNATLARLGVPAHTISTSQMDMEPHYHRQSDELGTLDMKNMTEIIKAIALSSKTIISGSDTPTRVAEPLY